LRERGWLRLYPAYFDSSKSRIEGRRVARELAVDRPRLEEVAEAARRLGLEVKVVEDARYPRCWWDLRGAVLVEKKMRKEELLRRVARSLREVRAGLRRGPR